jgi:hypothetical protein
MLGRGARDGRGLNRGALLPLDFIDGGFSGTGRDSLRRSPLPIVSDGPAKHSATDDN